MSKAQAPLGRLLISARGVPLFNDALPRRWSVVTAKGDEHSCDRQPKMKLCPERRLAVESTYVGGFGPADQGKAIRF